MSPASSLLLAALASFSALTAVSAQESPRCIYIGGSTTCPAYNTSYISTGSNVTVHFPFLSNVTNVTTFDEQLLTYVHGDYVRTKYQDLIGCSDVNLNNTIDYYARYTISFICNAIVQISLDPCLVPASSYPPLCASSCGDFALSEDAIASSDLCGTPGQNAMSQIRADYTNCALPADSLSTTCMYGYENEPENCGYQDNLSGFCSFCNTTSTVNSTDSCCVTGQAESRCANVTLPTYGSMQPLFTTTTSAAPGPTSSAASSGATGGGLSGGQIAGIVVGSVLGAALILGIIIGCCVFMRRRRDGKENNSLNQPSPPRAGSTKAAQPPPPAFEPLPGSRVTRMTALDGSGTATPTRGASAGLAGAALGGAAGAAAARHEKSSSEDESSPEYSSPDGAGHSSSERMSSFKDYYSAEDIHPNDHVSVLWAYEPRAGDEFQLERGDMLRVVGIWDDGWATGVRLTNRAEEWEPERDTQRDSGVSAGRPQEPAPANGEVKAFPLVCVCLPQHWKKTVEGEDGAPGSSDGPPAAD